MITAEVRALRRLQARLERAELELLRRHVLELDAKIEAAERRIEIAETRAHNAECVAYMWWAAANPQHATEDVDAQPTAFGLTKEGQIVRVDA